MSAIITPHIVAALLIPLLDRRRDCVCQNLYGWLITCEFCLDQARPLGRTHTKRITNLDRWWTVLIDVCWVATKKHSFVDWNSAIQIRASFWKIFQVYALPSAQLEHSRLLSLNRRMLEASLATYRFHMADKRAVWMLQLRSRCLVRPWLQKPRRERDQP